MKFFRRLVVSLAALASSGPAFAQNYPAKPVRILVGSTPGAAVDSVARIIADKLSVRLGQQFHVANAPGDGSNIASGMAASSLPDGYTLLMVTTSFLSNPSIYAEVPYDPVKDFTPITIVAVSPNVVTVHPSVPAETIKDLVAIVKASPGQFNFAVSGGVGSMPHLSGELFRMTQQIDDMAVQATGAGAIQSTVRGRTLVAFSPLVPVAPLVKDGLLRALAITSNKRSPLLPNVPTMAEAGIDGQEAHTFMGILAPAHTPKDIISLLHREIVQLVMLPDVQKDLGDRGVEVVANSPDEFSLRIKVEMEKWGNVIREAKIKIERPKAWEKGAQGGEDVDALNEQVFQLYGQGKRTEATQVAERALVLADTTLGIDHPSARRALSALASTYRALGRYAEAEPLYQRVLSAREKALGADHPDVAENVNNLATLYESQNRYSDAVPLQQRALAIREKTLGPDHSDVGDALNTLAILYFRSGRYADAEPLFLRSLTLAENTLGRFHTTVGNRLNNLAALYLYQGRNAEAEPLDLRALAIREKELGPNHSDVGQSLTNLAVLYNAQNRYAEAEPLLQRGLRIREKTLGPHHTDVAHSLNILAALYEGQDRYSEAMPLYQRALTIREKALGPGHPDVGETLNALATLYAHQGRRAEAEPLLQRALAIQEAALGPDHPGVGSVLHNLADLAFAQRDWALAADFWRRSTGVTVRRTQRGTDDLGQVLTGKRTGEAEHVSYRFRNLVKAVYRLTSEGRSSGAELPREMFQTAQWAQGSEAASSLAQMAARGAKRDVGLSLLIRERQDLVAEWQKRDGVRSSAVSTAPEKRDRAADAANAAGLGAIHVRIADIDRRLSADFSDYTALSRPAPLSIEEIQSLLRAEEALVLFLDTPAWQLTPEETFIWVVTKTHMRWVRSELGTSTLTREVAALRCGLDVEAWADAGKEKCASLLSIEPDKVPKGSASLPFDVARAHELYKALFAQADDLIRDKHLLVVPSGPLTQLPFHVLVMTTPLGGDYKSTAWLARKHAITVLPAVSSLKALRRVAKPSAAKKPMIGFGNPLLDGDQDHWQWGTHYKQQAALARQKQGCPQTPWQRVAGLFHPSRGVAPMATRQGRPDLDHLRVQMPLPDTADELCAVAKDLGLSPDDIALGANATETTIKRLSDEGRLADYRVVHFATHGTLSGEISGTSEPGLILSPPREQTDTDDGYLSASEIAALKLDADWVILSACNTAAGGAGGAEALSGLARSFFYAGARALLVSHWSVDSAATVKLITSAIGIIKRDKTVGRAEALRRAMLSMVDDVKEPARAHPAYWAPFVVVGEGAPNTKIQAIGDTTKAVRRPPRKASEGWTAEMWKKQLN